MNDIIAKHDIKRVSASASYSPPMSKEERRRAREEHAAWVAAEKVRRAREAEAEAAMSPLQYALSEARAYLASDGPDYDGDWGGEVVAGLMSGLGYGKD